MDLTNLFRLCKLAGLEYWLVLLNLPVVTPLALPSPIMNWERTFEYSQHSLFVGEYLLRVRTLNSHGKLTAGWEQLWILKANLRAAFCSELGEPNSFASVGWGTPDASEFLTDGVRLFFPILISLTNDYLSLGGILLLDDIEFLFAVLRCFHAHRCKEETHKQFLTHLVGLWPLHSPIDSRGLGASLGWGAGVEEGHHHNRVWRSTGRHLKGNLICRFPLLLLINTINNC